MKLGISPLRGNEVLGYKHLFLRYVSGFDQTRHCNQCLMGGTETRVSPTKARRGVIELRDAPHVYLCGIASDGEWAHNLHLVVRPAPGQIAEAIGHNRTVFYIQDAQVEPIPELPLKWRGLPDPMTTCRMFRWGVATFGYTPKRPWNSAE